MLLARREDPAELVGDRRERRGRQHRRPGQARHRLAAPDQRAFDGGVLAGRVDPDDRVADVEGRRGAGRDERPPGDHPRGRQPQRGERRLEQRDPPVLGIADDDEHHSPSDT